MTINSIWCSVYASKKDDESYIFVNREDGLSAVPEALLTQFPEPRLVTEFELNVDRKLARADAEKVLASIEEHGFYLQMPPPKDAHLNALSARNELLPRA